jgi:predicted aconitase with swiveling domain
VAHGQPLVTKQPINFLTMIDPCTGTVQDYSHELYGRSLSARVLVFPNAVGSSVGAYILYSLKMKGLAPLAVICMKRTDAITASACAISDIPAVDIREQQSALISLTRSEGTEVIVDADSCYIEVIKRN